MKGINDYFKNLTDKQIENKEHRDFVGGLWEEVGQLQLNFLQKNGLKQDSLLLDIGCGSLRGGLHFINYLNPRCYFGLDINPSLIRAGETEIKEANLTDKQASLLVNDKFEFHHFNQQFDFMLSVSVFTHLPINIILRCLANAKSALKKNGKYYATFFEAPSPVHLSTIKQSPGGINTHYDIDPFHYARSEITYMSNVIGLNLEFIGDWDHPRNQKMVCFTHKS